MILQNKSVEKLDYFTSMSEAEGLHWVILHGSPAEICGIISVEEGSFEHCDHNLAIWIKPTHRRNGVALEAICLALGLAKEQGVTEIESKIHITNEPTLQLMSKVSREFLTEKKSRMFDDYQEWVIKLSKDKDG
jgi:RimJ/RimL family protein N-acetyltransferase